MKNSNDTIWNRTSDLPICSTVLIYKGRGKVHPRTGHEGPEGEWKYNSTLSLTSALDGGGWSTPRRGRFTLGKTRYPLYRRLGVPQARSGRARKISPPTGIRFPDHPARSESPYRQCYPGPPNSYITISNRYKSAHLF
jgi:hypothetical protein